MASVSRWPPTTCLHPGAPRFLELCAPLLTVFWHLYAKGALSACPTVPLPAISARPKASMTLLLGMYLHWARPPSFPRGRRPGARGALRQWTPRRARCLDRRMACAPATWRLLERHVHHLPSLWCTICFEHLPVHVPIGQHIFLLLAATGPLRSRQQVRTDSRKDLLC